MKKAFVLCIFLLLMAPVCWAASDETSPIEKGVYLNLSTQYLRLDLPDYSPIALEDTSWQVIKYLDGSDGREEAVMPGLTLGVPIPALNIVLELGVEMADWNGSTNKTYNYGPDYRVGWLPLGGDLPTWGVLGNYSDVEARMNRSGDYSRIELLGKYPFRFKDLKFAPFVGPSFMSLEEDFSLHAIITDSLYGTHSRMHEHLDSDYIGGRIGVTVAGRFCDFATWELTPAVGIYHLDADYSGNQQILSSIDYSSAAHDDKSRTTTAASVLGKITLHYQQLSLSFMAGMDYLEDVAKVRHSTLGQGGVNNSGEPAHIEFDSSLNSRFGIELGVHFW